MRTVGADTGTQGGFTLLEALVATAVLSLISLLLAPALLGAMDAASRNHGVMNRIERDAALGAVLDDLFVQSHQVPASEDGMGFEGAAGRVTFLVRPASGSLQRAELALVNGALRLELSALELPSQMAQRETVSVTLADGFETGRFYYVGLDRTRWRLEDRLEWQEDNPPRLVILVLDWPDGTRTRIQALVTGEGRFECRFDSGRGLCLGDSY
ncbi:prepilin-type N-terminal cleavage/methylation domain-containing protein [Maricaulaceae bacterium EIL42A08]|nr:prepilin-type N-terminal cleavage/methylation domain-containing protein [Maricaulaceae bacterium EIL42A08]